jgi:hypothetical protein
LLALRLPGIVPLALTEEGLPSARLQRHLSSGQPDSCVPRIAHDGNGIAGTTVECLQYICLILLVRLRAGTVDRKNANVVCRKTPHSECTAERSNARINTFRILHEHAIGGEHIFFLAVGPSLEVGNVAGEEISITGFTLGLAELHFLFELFLFKGKPVSDLLTAESNLTSTVENRRRVFRVDFAHNAKCAETRGGDRVTRFVTAKQLGTADQ